jgi:hypothetical protein
MRAFSGPKQPSRVRGFVSCIAPGYRLATPRSMPRCHRSWPRRWRAGAANWSVMFCLIRISTSPPWSARPEPPQPANGGANASSHERSPDLASGPPAARSVWHGNAAPSRRVTRDDSRSCLAGRRAAFLAAPRAAGLRQREKGGRRDVSDPGPRRARPPCARPQWGRSRPALSSVCVPICGSGLVAAHRLLIDARSRVVRRRACRLAIESAEPSSALT